ncbi:MAG: polysaccharide deacetylase family protein [Calditrichia bacterium]
MNTAVKYCFYRFFEVAGFYEVMRERHHRLPIVLTYHGVLPKIPKNGDYYEYRNFVSIAQFERQLTFLLKHYRPLQIEEFYKNGKDVEGGFLITFDDGFRNNFKYALPSLEKFGLKACFFITTKLIGTREFLWTEQVTRLLQRTRIKKLLLEIPESTVFPLRNQREREKASIFIRQYLKQQKPQILNNKMEIIFEQLSDVNLEMQKKEEERYLFMKWNEIQGLVRAGHTVGSHTHTHRMLSQLSEEESLQELKLSKELIESQTGHTCKVLSYPNGGRQDFTEIQKQQLKSLGYKCAFTEIRPFNGTIPQDKYELQRINVTLKLPMPVFAARLCGFKRN